MVMDDTRDFELLPCDVLVEILSRLPGKSLMRFKCVSKRWLSLITDPVFAQMHYIRSSKRGGSGVFVTPTMDTVKCLMCIIDMNKEPFERLSTLEPDIPYDNNSTTNIVNGLVCFYHDSYEKRRIYLYNLTTRENISLPPIQAEDSYVPYTGQFSRTCLLVFDPMNKEYKVLQFYSRGLNHKMKCQVFTIGGRRNAWRPLDISDIQKFNFNFNDFTSQRGFCDDGFLYWTEKNVLVVFDVALESFKLVGFPEKERVNYRWPPTAVKVEGCVFLLIYVDFDAYQFMSRITTSRNAAYQSRITTSSNGQVQIVWWKLKDTSAQPQWTKEVVAYEDHFLKVIDKLNTFNHLGQTFLKRPPVDLYSKSSTIDYYDLIKRKHEEFEVNDTRGVLGTHLPFWVTEVSDNIMSLRIALQSQI